MRPVDAASVNTFRALLEKGHRRLEYIKLRTNLRLDREPPSLQPLSDSLRNATTFNDSIRDVIFKREETAVTEIGRHLLANIHRVRGLLDTPECGTCSDPNTPQGQCTVQLSRVSSLVFRQWPTQELIVPCVTPATMEYPLYELSSFWVVSCFWRFSFQELHETIITNLSLDFSTGGDRTARAPHWTRLPDSNGNVRACSEVPVQRLRPEPVSTSLLQLSPSLGCHETAVVWNFPEHNDQRRHVLERTV